MLVGPDYGTTDRKRIPEDELATAYDLKTIWDAEVRVFQRPCNSYGFFFFCFVCVCVCVCVLSLIHI